MARKGDKVTSTGADEPEEMLSSQRFFPAFFALDAYAPGAAEALRAEYCETCQTTQGMPDELRTGVCRRQRCGMRETAIFTAVQRWSHETRRKLTPPEAADDAAFDALNYEITQAGCLTPIIGRDDDGRLIVTYASPSLRGYVHLVLLFETAGLAGYALLGNVWSRSGRKVGQHVAETRAVLRARRMELARAWRLSEVTFPEIARRLNLSVDTVEDWFNKGAE